MSDFPQTAASTKRWNKRCRETRKAFRSHKTSTRLLFRQTKCVNQESGNKTGQKKWWNPETTHAHTHTMRRLFPGLWLNWPPNLILSLKRLQTLRTEKKKKSLCCWRREETFSWFKLLNDRKEPQIILLSTSEHKYLNFLFLAFTTLVWCILRGIIIFIQRPIITRSEHITHGRRSETKTKTSEAEEGDWNMEKSRVGVSYLQRVSDFLSLLLLGTLHQPNMCLSDVLGTRLNNQLSSWCLQEQLGINPTDSSFILGRNILQKDVYFHTCTFTFTWVKKLKQHFYFYQSLFISFYISSSRLSQARSPSSHLSFF